MKDRIWKLLRNGAIRVLAALTVVLALFMVIAPQPALAASITVNTTADENGTGANCSLREAITAANTDTAFGGCIAGAGADTITLPAGTYQLTLANAGGTNEDNNATGDLDINSSLTINGAGSGTTIIQAGTNTSNGIDKVIGANPTCASGVNVTITGVTVRFGRNTQPITDPNFSFTGGGIDWCAGGTGGTFTLSDSVVSDNTNVNGYGGGLNVDTVSSPTTVNISNVTFSNNQTLSATNTANGGAINLFGDSPTITITNSTFSGNHTTNSTSGGGAIYFRPTTVGHLSISGSTFTNNTAAGIGGAIATDSHGAGSTITIQNSSFTGNTATNSFGGALDLDATNLNTTPFSLTHLTITGNTAGQAGGGLFIGAANVTMSKSLIVGNSAPTASGLRKSVDAATATVTNNWWGCSTGPGASPCDTASTAGGTLTFNPWYRDQLTASPTSVVTNQSTSLTASFLTNSASTAVPVADLAEIIGRSVTWAATNGNLSGTQGTVQAAGTATGSFQATSAGTAIISAKVDNDNTAPVSSNVLSLTVDKANTTTTITGDTPDPTVTGQSYTVSYSVLGSQGNSPTAPTGNVTVSDGTDSCIGTVAAGQCTLTSLTAGSKTLTATYAGDSNFNASPASAGVAHTVNKADTTTTITSDSPDPSVVGQAITFQYSVSVTAPGGGTPTGNVTVSDGGSNSCTGTVAAGQCSITFTSPGAKSLTAAYAGDLNYNGSTSAAEAHTVNKADTATTITSDIPDPSNLGQGVTVNFTVAAVAPGAGTPTGNVTVTDGVDSCTGTAPSGTCAINLTTTGARTLTATYAGDGNFNGSVSSGEPHSVNQFATTTTISSDNPDPSVVGQSVIVQYSVSSGSGTPTGNVTVSDGVDSCTGTVAAGQCAISFTSAGAKSLTATYAGDNGFAGSTSTVQAHQVDKAATTTTITLDNPDPSAGGQSVAVNYQVTVTAPGSGTPTGNVTVSDGVDSCIGTVAAGSCNITLTTGGARTLTATYAGDSNFNGSISAGEPHFVDTTPPDVTINQASGQADPTGVSPVDFDVVFSEAVTGFGDSPTDITLSGTAGATTAVVTGSGTTYTVAVSGMTVAGTVIASIPAGAASDAAGNLSTASTSTDNTVTFADNVPPTVISSIRLDPNPTSATSVHFTVTFSESVTGVDSSDFSVTTTGLVGSAVTGVSGSGSAYTVTVDVGTGSSGTLRLDVLDDDSIKDAFNNPLGGSGAGNGSFTGGETYTIAQTGGADTTGVYRPSNGIMFLKNSNTTGFADIATNYGIPGDYPVVGDWDGNGTVTIGIYRNGVFYLRNSNSAGFADLVFAFGQSGDQPVAGDWDGNGADTIGVYRPSTGQFLLRNSNSAGAADLTFALGNPGDVGIAGDWNGDGTDTTGVFRPSNGVIFLKNTNSTGIADVSLNYGIPGDKPVTGDWDNDGIDTIGVYRNGTFYLRNSNTPGFGEIVFALGNPGDMPIAGNWDGIP